MSSRFLLAGLITLTPLFALADDAPAGRYQLQPVEGGVVRLDTATGEMTLCKSDAGKLTCAAAAATPAASAPAASDIAALKARVDALERQVASGSKGADLPTDAEVDRSLSIMEKFMRRFMGIAKDLDQENHGGSALPQKT
ncbi:hypothetical protein [Rhizobium sp. C4]|uniref:hypothetical protein n=1 Tax=Rhizobium sp. C4 TaxID=1349800 RepID=UPI001E50CE5C|nr:hypothetical protein [Rhizobium sp. C4]MCD2174598.1 hypothetical protein [Rhizobium sp. C4]